MSLTHSKQARKRVPTRRHPTLSNQELDAVLGAAASEGREPTRLAVNVQPLAVANKPIEVEDLQHLQSVAALTPSATKLRRMMDEQVSHRILSTANRMLRKEADRKALQRLFRNLQYFGGPARGVLHFSESAETSRRLLNALDEAICNGARDMGIKICDSRLARARIAEWEAAWEDEPNRAELYERFYEKLGNALALHLRISRGKGKAPIDPDLKRVGRELNAEVKKLRGLLKLEFLQRRLPNRDAIRSAVVRLVSAPANKFFHLRVSLTTVLRFDAVRQDAGLLGLLNDTASPSVFVRDLLGYSTGRSGEALRQALTQL